MVQHIREADRSGSRQIEGGSMVDIFGRLWSMLHTVTGFHLLHCAFRSWLQRAAQTTPIPFRSTFNPFDDPVIPNKLVVPHTATFPTDQSLLPTGRSRRQHMYKSIEFMDPTGIHSCITTKVATIQVEYQMLTQECVWRVFTKTTATEKKVHLTDNGLTPIVD